MWSEEFERILRGYVKLPPGQPLNPEDTLIDLGLDSMDTVNLLVDLEQSLSITFTDDLLTAETFATPLTLWTALLRLPVESG